MQGQERVARGGIYGTRPWLARAGVALLVGGIALIAWRYWREIQTLWTDVALAREWLRSLGPWGAAMFVLVNALQVVVAPLPGYATYLAAGYVFGVWWGGLYATLGMALGGGLAAALARFWGRPLVVRLIGEAALRRGEHLIRADSLWVWFLAFLGPTGDAPFHLAGLSSLPLWQVVGLAVLVRTPGVFVSAAVGAGLVHISLRTLGLILFAAGVVSVALYHVRRTWERRVHAGRCPGAG